MNTKKYLRRGLIYTFIILAMLSCKLPFDLPGRSEDTQPTETLEEIALVVSTEEEVVPTLTITPTITPTATATPDPISLLPEYVQEALHWELAFKDDFSDETKGWFVGEFADELSAQRREISNGQYLWTMEFPDNLEEEWISFGVVPSYSRVSDIEASVKVKLQDGYPETAYGFAFRQSPSGAYLFTIRNDSYRLAEYDYENTTAIIDWTPSDLIIPGGMNELRVLANGDHITLFINDEIAADITNTTFPYGRVLLVFDFCVPGEFATLAFDDIQLKTRAATIHQEAMQWQLFIEETFESNQNEWFSGPKLIGSSSESKSMILVQGTRTIRFITLEGNF